MSSGFVPPGPAGGAGLDLPGQPGHDVPSAAALAARSQLGRGYLLVSEGLLSFHSRDGDDVVHVGDALPVTHSMWASRLVLATSTGPLEVSVSRRHRRRLIEMLSSARVHGTTASG
jgi:hypothetical protein